MRALVLVTGLIGLAGTVGCLGLDEEAAVHDLRLLAVRTEPAEILLPSSFALGGGPPVPGAPQVERESFAVSVEVFAFDPREGLVTTTAFLCPDGEESSCRDYDPEDGVLAGASDAVRPELEAVYLPQGVSGQAIAPSGSVDDVRFSVVLTPAVMDTITAGVPLGISPFEPRFVVEALSESALPGVNSARGFKRLPISWDLADPALPVQQVQAAAAPFGIELCDDQTVHEVEGVAPCYRSRGPNQNPELIGFNLIPDDDDEVVPVFEDLVAELGPRPVLRVDPGATLKIRPVFAFGVLEPYQALVQVPDEDNIRVEDRFEDLVCNWYLTSGSTTFFETAVIEFGPGGERGPPGTGPEATLDNAWTLPTRADIGGDIETRRDSLIMVARDQRGGVAVGHIDVEYRP